MIKGANKNPQVHCRVYAYDARGEVVDRDEYFGRYEPALFFLEFMMKTREKYKTVVRFTCDVAE